MDRIIFLGSRSPAGLGGRLGLDLGGVGGREGIRSLRLISVSRHV